MSAYVPASSYDDDAATEAPRVSPAVLWLLSLLVGVYFLQITLQGDLPSWLGFDGATWAGRPWTVLSYAFVHAGFWHLALNGYTLWAFGPRLERVWGTRRFVTFYLWCALGGAVAHALFTPAAALVGASAAVFGLLVAYARRWPNDEVALFGIVPMRVKVLVGFLIGINVLYGVLPGLAGAGDRTAYLAHLGGVAFALLWLLWPGGPSVERVRQRVSAAPDLGDDLPRAVPRGVARPRDAGPRDANPRDLASPTGRSEADDAVARSQALTAPPSPPAPPTPPVRAMRNPAPRNPAPRNPTPRTPAPRPQALAAVAPAAVAPDMDAVLDKISREGLASLTVDERRVLEESSRKLRGDG